MRRRKVSEAFRCETSLLTKQLKTKRLRDEFKISGKKRRGMARCVSRRASGMRMGGIEKIAVVQNDFFFLFMESKI